MKSSLKRKEYKTSKNLDFNQDSKIKKIFKRTSDFSRTVVHKRNTFNKDLKELGRHNEEDEKKLLSNANLDILKSLINCAKVDILNDSSFLFLNNNDDPKDKSIENRIKRKKSLFELKENSIHNIRNKKFRINSNKNVLIHSNTNDCSSGINYSNIKKEYIKSQNRFKNQIKMRKKKFGKGHSSDTHLKIFNIKSHDKIIHNNNNQRQRSKSIVFNDQNILYNRLDNLAKISKRNIEEDGEKENNNKYKGILSEIEIIKINEHIHNDINFIQLKKKIFRLKKIMQNKNNSNDFFKNKAKKSSKSLDKINIMEEKNENKDQTANSKDGNSNSQIIQNLEDISSNKKLNSSKNLNKDTNLNDKYRILIRIKDIYDSLDDEEYKEEEIDYYISPNSWYIIIFDCFLFLFSLIYFIFVPLFLSNNFFILKESSFWNIIFLLVDIIYI